MMIENATFVCEYASKWDNIRTKSILHLTRIYTYSKSRCCLMVENINVGTYRCKWLRVLFRSMFINGNHLDGLGVLQYFYSTDFFPLFLSNLYFQPHFRYGI